MRTVPSDTWSGGWENNPCPKTDELVFVGLSPELTVDS